jgi:DNA helicase-2/ATP-dependent DNA helicase PcrA
LEEYTLDSASRTDSDLELDEHLNPQQQDVVKAGDGPVLVVAGAGTGKTHALTHRVAHLVDRGIPAKKILLLTFTNKAAQSMTDRVSGLLREDIDKLWSGTFHSIGNRILRREAERLGYSSDFSILDTEDAKTLMKQCIADADVGHLEKRFPKAKVLYQIQSLALNTATNFREHIQAEHPQFQSIADPLTDIVKLYRKRKRQMSLMDFDDLLTNWQELFEQNEQVRKAYASRFKHVLVDEYQDINHLQDNLVHLMASEHENLTVVGDDCQSIYGFRGADYKNILSFPDRYDDCQTYKLEINYRSTPEILELSNQSIHQNEDQFHKTLQSTKNSGPEPTLVKVDDADQQAAFICQRILELRDDGIDLSEMAVLYRAHYHAMELQLEMARRGIPFVMRSGLRFFEQAHIKDVLSYLKFIFNPRDELSFLRLAQQWRGIGSKRSDQIWQQLERQSDPLSVLDNPAVEKPLPEQATESWRKIRDILVELRDSRLDTSPGQLVDIILENGYREYAKQSFEKPENRIEDLEQFADYADGYDDLDHLLGEITLLTGMSGEEIMVGEEQEDEDHVCLSTIHRAKGLEWKAVFTLWLSDGYFPSNRASDPKEIEEERRLFYVATTRAEEELYLTQPQIRQSRGGRRSVIRESQFIRELRELPSENPFREWQVR